MKELKDIPLCAFVEMYRNYCKGDNSNAEVIDAYFEATGHITATKELALLNERLNGETMIQLASSCRTLMSIGRNKAVCDVLGDLGDEIHPNDIPTITRMINDLEAKGKGFFENAKNIGKPLDLLPEPDFFKSELHIVAEHFKVKDIAHKWSTQKFADAVKEVCIAIQNM